MHAGRGAGGQVQDGNGAVQAGDGLPGQRGAVGVGEDGGRAASRSSAVTSGAASRQLTAAGSAPARIRPSMAVTQPAWFLAMTGTTSPGAIPAAANPAAERSTAAARAA